MPRIKNKGVNGMKAKSESKDIKAFRTKIIKRYLSEVEACIAKVADTEHGTLEKIIQVLREAHHKNSQVITMGNGGSASTASHFAADMSKAWIEGKFLRYRSFALTDNLSLMTAWMNDAGYDNMFVGQLESILTYGDVVFGFSGSGSSKNVINAIKYANEHGAITVGFTGFDGGDLAKTAQICLTVPSNNMRQIEDVHLVFCHLIKEVLVEETALMDKERKA